MVGSGAVLLRELSYYVSKHTLEPIESTQIDVSIVDDFKNAEFRVTTIVPVLDAPYKSVRIVDQEGLDELLQGYNEYAEFIVEVIKVDSDQSA